MKIVIYLLAVLAVTVLGYGYWYAYSHAYLDMDLQDEKNKPIGNAKVLFSDEAGELLAEGKTNEDVSYVLLRHPVRGYCEPTLQDQNARMRECLKEHSEWQAKWLPRFRKVTIRTESCEVKDVPVNTNTHATWGFWWVPLPHIGGLESTRYTTTVKIDRSKCAIV